jgi:hypothetical protein
MDEFHFQEGEKDLLLRLRGLFKGSKRDREKKVLIERSSDEYKVSSLTPHGKIKAKKDSE